MTNEKKDLTRIEDLADFLHSEDATEDENSFEDSDNDSPPDLPDFPPTEDAFTFSESTEFSTDKSNTTPVPEDDSSDGSPSDFSFTEESSIKSLPSDEDLAFPDPSEFETSSFNFVQEDNLPEPELLEQTDVVSPPQELEFGATEVITDETPVKDEEKPHNLPEPTTETFPPEEEALSDVINMADFSSASKEPNVEETSEPSARITPDDMPYRPREDFAEVRSFAEKAVLADVMAESNPAFSVIAHGIKFVEDSEDIMTILRELKFPQDMMDHFHRQIERGSLLIPRISEFTAIYLCHKLRRFRLNLQMGLSDQLHAPREANDSEKGLVSRRSLGQNQQHHFNFREDPSESRNILLSTLGQLDGHVIEKYLGVASEHAFLDSDQVEDDVSEAINASYDELAQKLKAHALEQKANAVVGINYQLTPMPSDNPSYGHFRYKLTCTGNLVWVNRLSV